MYVYMHACTHAYMWILQILSDVSQNCRGRVAHTMHTSERQAATHMGEKCLSTLRKRVVLAEWMGDYASKAFASLPPSLSVFLSLAPIYNFSLSLSLSLSLFLILHLYFISALLSFPTATILQSLHLELLYRSHKKQ